MAYGKELIIDLYGCSIEKFNRQGLTQYFEELCDLIKMEREKLEFWDYEDCPEEKLLAPIHLDGTTAVQFISTSNITIHTLDKINEILINVFSCKKFNCQDVLNFTIKFFEAKESDSQVIVRGRKSQCQM